MRIVSWDQFRALPKAVRVREVIAVRDELRDEQFREEILFTLWFCDRHDRPFPFSGETFSCAEDARRALSNSPAGEASRWPLSGD